MIAVQPKSVPLDTLELTSDSGPSKSDKLFSNRQKSKAITQAINGKLCYLNSDIHKDYQAAFFCNDVLLQNGKSVTANYCRKRNCIVCSRIKAARLMKSYSEPLFGLTELHMVTLTKPNVLGHELRPEIVSMKKGLSKVKDNIRKVHKLKTKGLWKLEITYNERTGKFNPHYHILVEGVVQANLIRSEWLRLFKDSNYRAQDVRPVQSNSALLEVFKYVTKAIVKNHFDPRALDTMYRAIKGMRTIQPMGIKRVKESDEDHTVTEITHRNESIDVWKWCNKKHDWYNSKDEKFNNGYISQETKRIIHVINQSDTNEEKTDERDTDQRRYREIIRKARGRKRDREHPFF